MLNARIHKPGRPASCGFVVLVLALVLACNALPRVEPAKQSAQVTTSTPGQAPDTPTVIPATSAPTATPIILGELSADINYALPLTVRHATDTSATLYFELSAPSEGIVLIAADGEGQRSIPLDASTPRQQIVVEDLSPGTLYRATVGLGHEGVYQQPGFLEQAWGSVRFRTQSLDKLLRIGVIGDSGFGQPVTFDLASQMAAQNLDFVLHTGDVVYNIEQNSDPYEAYALKYYWPFAPLLQTMPIYTTVGNHDVEQEALYQGTPFIYRAFPSFAVPGLPAPTADAPSQWYAVGYGDIQFLLLDTQTFFNEPGRGEQLTWLSERLADERFAYSIPVFHVPPFSSGLHPYDGTAVRSEWVPLFEAAGVPLVLSGHDHNYERLSVGGITYIVTGGGTTVLYDQSITLPESQLFVKETHYVLLEVYADRIDVQTIELGGEVLDQTTILLGEQ